MCAKSIDDGRNIFLSKDAAECEQHTHYLSAKRALCGTASNARDVVAPGTVRVKSPGEIVRLWGLSQTV